MYLILISSFFTFSICRFIEPSFILDTAWWCYSSVGAVDGDTLYTSCYRLLTLITLSHILPQTDGHNELSSHTHTHFFTLKLQMLWITAGFLMLTFSAGSSLCGMCVSSLWRQCLKFVTANICRSTEQFGMLLTWKCHWMFSLYT